MTRYLVWLSGATIISVIVIWLFLLFIPQEAKPQYKHITVEKTYTRPKLMKPQIEWVYWVDQKDRIVVGLIQSDFISMTQYIEGLEYEYELCRHD